ncbi:MAG: glycosyl hydrolase family 18 protein [Veillonella sp.]|nr:glycosyl hydrolase family 18 protein [Veillonella sp.]
MIRKSTIIKSLTALVMSALSSTIVQAEVLVPLDQFLATTTRHYEANQYKTAYTVYIPQSELQGDTVILNPAAVGEPVKLPITKKDGISYVDIESEPAMLGVSYTKNNGQLILGPAPEASTVKAPYTLQTPLAWAFDPWTTEGIPYQAKLNTSGDNIISPSWFKLHSLGLEASSNVNIDYVKAYKDKGYHIWPLITNRFDSNFTSGKFAHNLVQYAYIYGFDGYNFDFENINYADRDRLTTFVAYLSNHLHQYNIKTSIDVTGYSDSPEWSLVYNRKALADTVDYVVLMAYDETWAKSTTAGPVASYPWVRSHTERMLSEVPSQKLILGVPFYMRLWHETNGYAKSETLAMKNTSNYFANYRDKMTWDDRLKLYYLSIPTASGSDRIWFEDNTSLGLKLDLVKELHLGGFAAWRKGFEDISTITMIQEKDLGRGIPKSPTAVVPEPVVQEAKPLTKLEQYKLRLEEKEKEKAAKAEAKRKAKEEKEAAKRKAKEEVEKVKAEKKRLEEEAKARKEHNKQTVKEQNDLYTSHSSDQNTSPKNDLIKTIQVVKR